MTFDEQIRRIAQAGLQVVFSVPEGYDQNFCRVQTSNGNSVATRGGPLPPSELLNAVYQDLEKQGRLNVKGNI